LSLLKLLNACFIFINFSFLIKGSTVICSGRYGAVNGHGWMMWRYFVFPQPVAVAKFINKSSSLIILETTFLKVFTPRIYP